jgi:acetyl esterase/lipase
MRILSLLLLFLFSTTLQAQERFLDSIFEVTPPKTEVYAVKDGEELMLDIYEPKNDTENQRPLIVFMYGGGFSGGSPKHPDLARFSETATAKGYVVVQIAYRLTRKGQTFGCDFEASGKIETFKNAAEDFMDAVSYLVDKKSELRIDPENIIVGGSSAGAEAVLSAVYNPGLMFEDQQAYKNLEFAAVISLAGAIPDARHIGKKNAVPGIFFHGTKDKLVPYATAPHHFCEPGQPGYLMLDGSQTIAKKLEDLNSSYLLVSVEEAGHEISGVPFSEFPLLFRFLKKVVLEDKKQQITLTK